MSGKTAAKKGQRVYEYMDQDGNVFWSFEKLPSVVTHSRILKLGDRIGTHFDTYVGDLRATRRLLLEGELEEVIEEAAAADG
jgi:hypothetical protein